MVSIARKNLFQEKTRLSISVGGAAFSILLILLLLGLNQGYVDIMGNYINNAGADIWVASEGANDLFHTFTLLSSNLEKNISKISGVNEVYPFIGRAIQVELEKQNENATMFIVGYDAKEGIGGPWNVVAGKSKPDRNEVIAEQAFVKNHGLELRDTIEIEDEKLRIAGVSKGTNLLVFQMIFMPVGEAQKLVSQEGLVNYFLVLVDNPRNSARIAEKIEDKIGGITAFSREEFVDNNEKLIKDSFTPVLGALAFIGFFIGVIIIGLTIYTATFEKLKEFGMLKAIGATNKQIYRIIFEQALVIATLGFILGSLLSLISWYLIPSLVPEFILSFKLGHFVYVALASVGMSIFAAYASIKKIIRIDPAVAFKT